MIQLFIEKNLIFMDDSNDLPFSHKINNLENFDIIGVEKSKTINIKRCPQNDAVFGYLGDAQRLTFNLDNDNKIGVSFNQTKQIDYRITDDGLEVGSGKVIIENITDLNYEITLYDDLLYLLETLDGDPQTGDGYLSSLDILDSDKNSININNYINNIQNLNDKALIPVYNITSDELNDTSFRCIDKSNGEVTTFDLDADLTQLQARTIKANQIEYATPVNSVIESINEKYNNIIEVDPKLNTYFDELHMFLGKQKKTNKVENNVTLNTLNDITKLSNGSYPFIQYPVDKPFGTLSTSSSFFFPLNIAVSNQNVQKLNGKYYMEVPVKIKLKATPLNSNYSYFNGINYTSANLKQGDHFGNLYIKTRICTYNQGVTPNIGVMGNYNVKVINNKIDFLYGENSSILRNSTESSITVEKILVLEFEYHPEVCITTNQSIGIEFNIKEPQEDTYFFSYNVTTVNKRSYSIIMDVNLPSYSPRLQFNSFDKIYTGDIINGSTLYPKIPIKQFILNLAKFHNLELINNFGKLLIRKKLYSVSTEQLNVVAVNSFNPKIFDFSKISITTGLTDNDLFKNYEEINKQKYGQKNIDLNYSIRKKINNITYDVSIPAFAKDINKVAYDSFGDYYNAGRKKYATGVCNGLDNKIAFCFINKIVDDPIWIVDDTAYECGIFSGNEIAVPDEIKFVKTNWLVLRDGNKYVYFDSYNNNFLSYDIYTSLIQSIKLNTYYTASPYKIGPDGIVTKSLEINKPKYNYANLNDINYPESATHYDRYLKKQIEDIYNPNTHILDCDIYFNSKPNVYKIYNHKNTNYIISELPEYNPGGGLTKGVKLLSVNNTSNYITPYAAEEGFLKINYFSNVTVDSITVNGLIEYDGGNNIVTCGANYGLSYGNLSNNISISNSNIAFNIVTPNLTRNTPYYFQLYMISDNGIKTFSEILSFRTLDDYNPPTGLSVGIDVIGYNSAVATARLLSEGGYPVTEYGFVISQTPNPTQAVDIKYVIGYNTNYDNVSVQLIGLNVDTTYYVRYYAINQNGVGYSDNMIFTTLAATLPEITTTPAYSITPESMGGGGSSINLKGGTLIRKGWVAKIGSAPTYSVWDIRYNINTTNPSDFSGTNFSYTTEIKNTVLYYRAYVTTNIGTSYGQTILVTIPNYSLPIVTTLQAFDLTYNSITVRGKLESNGYDPLLIANNTAFVYSSTNINPTIGGAGCTTVYLSGVTSVGSTVIKVISGLQSFTNYFYRFVGINSVGVGYGEVLEQSTSTIAPAFDEFIVRRPNFIPQINEPDIYIELNIDTVEEIISGGILIQPNWDGFTDITIENCQNRIDFNTIQGGLNNYYYQVSLLEDYPVGTVTYRAWLTSASGLLYSFYTNDILKTI